MSLEKYLSEQLRAHPSMQARDVVKLCYQAARGAEHLLADTAAAERYFFSEFEAVTADDSVLYELISDDVARMNLAAWKQRGLPAAWLLRMFCASAAISGEGERRLVEYIDSASALVCEAGIPAQEWDGFIAEYKEQGMPSLHHSEAYRAAEKPAYRIVRRSWLRLIPLLERIDACSAKPCIITIDGRAGSGKSTLAEELAAVLDADIVHMDDFFLPPELRTAQRLSEAGGNIHYERFREEVMSRLHSGTDFEYRRFSCGEMKLSGSRGIRAGDYIIVEGSYSLHPEFGDYADVKIFCDVESTEQLRRLTARDGVRFAEMFRSRWIPMEEKYFSSFDIASKCDFIM